MVNIISRAGWNARAPRSRQTVSWSQRQEVTLHYSTGSVNQTPYSIQGYHMNTRGWSDIGYNFLVDHKGNAYEGRGWTVVGAHAAPRNTQGIGICYIGSDNMTDAAKRTVIELYDEANRRAGRTLARKGHRDINSTSCPGSNNYAWWKSSGFRDVAGGSGGSVGNVWTVGEHKVPTGAPMLSHGDSGALVKHLQRCLMAWKSDSLPEYEDDGDYGDETKTAVENFQASNGLQKDGVYGPNTAVKMKQVLTPAPTPPPEPAPGEYSDADGSRIFRDTKTEQVVPRGEWTLVRFGEGRYSLAFDEEEYMAYVAMTVEGLEKGDEFQVRFVEVRPSEKDSGPKYLRDNVLATDSPVHDAGKLHAIGSWGGQVPENRRIRVEVNHWSDSKKVQIVSRSASVLYSEVTPNEGTDS